MSNEMLEIVAVMVHFSQRDTERHREPPVCMISTRERTMEESFHEQLQGGRSEPQINLIYLDLSGPSDVTFLFPTKGC